MANYLIKNGTLFESFENLGDWTIGGTAGGSENINTTAGQFTEGTGGLRLVTAGGASSNRFATKTINQSFQNDGVMQLDVYIPDKTKTTGITLYLSEDSTFTNFYSISFTTILVTGLNRIRLNRDAWTRNGAADLGWAVPMIRFRVRVDAVANEIGEVTFDNFIRGIYGRPKFIFRFDDGWDDHIDIAKPIMDLYGFKGCTMVNQDSIGTANYMTLAELRTLLEAGWDVLNHTKSHTNLSTLSKADQQTEIMSEMAWMRDNGITKKMSERHIVLPNGGYNADTLALRSELDLRSLHTIVSPRTNVPNNPLDNADQLVYIDNIVNTVTLANAKARVDRAIAWGGCGMFLFHLLPAVATQSTEWPEADFSELCKYLFLKRSQIDVVTWTEYLSGLNN